MKRMLVVLCLLSLFLAPLCAAEHATQGQWRAVSIASGNQDLFAYFGSLALDARGVPHILFNDEDQALVKLAIWDGATWQISTAGNEQGYFCRLAYDTAGLLHGVYVTADGHLRYGTYDGAWAWQTVGEVGDGTYADLVLNSQGYPYIAHINAISGMLICHWFDGAAWHRDDIVQVGVNVMNYRELGIAISTDDVPHISAPYEPGGAASSLLHATIGTQGWGFELVDTVGTRGHGSAIIVDRQGVTHIAYRDSDARDLWHAWFDDAWHKERLDARGDLGYHASWALGPTGRLNLAYYEREGDLLRFGWWQGAVWQSETLSSITRCKDALTSLALDANGQPHLLAVRLQGSDRELNYVYFDALWGVSLPLIMR